MILYIYGIDFICIESDEYYKKLISKDAKYNLTYNDWEIYPVIYRDSNLYDSLYDLMHMHVEQYNKNATKYVPKGGSNTKSGINSSMFLKCEIPTHNQIIHMTNDISTPRKDEKYWIKPESKTADWYIYNNTGYPKAGLFSYNQGGSSGITAGIRPLLTLFTTGAENLPGTFEFGGINFNRVGDKLAFAAEPIAEVDYSSANKILKDWFKSSKKDLMNESLLIERKKTNNKDYYSKISGVEYNDRVEQTNSTSKLRKPQEVILKGGRNLQEVIENHQHWINEDCGGWPNMRADLSGEDLYNIDLSNVDLSNAYLHKANLSNSNLTGACLLYADLRGTNLSYADLSRANLSNANLLFANLSNINSPNIVLSSSDLTGVDLSHANLPDSELDHTNLRSARLCYAYLSNSFLYKANLYNADLSNAKLLSSNLVEANLTNANLDNTDLTNARLLFTNSSRAKNKDKAIGI